jgi:hypothetical protein
MACGPRRARRTAELAGHPVQEAAGHCRGATACDHLAQAGASSPGRRPVCPRQGRSRDLIPGRNQHQISEQSREQLAVSADGLPLGARYARSHLLESSSPCTRARLRCPTASRNLRLAMSPTLSRARERASIPARPVGPAGRLLRGQPLESLRRQVSPSGSRGRLDQLGHAPVVGHHLGRIRAGAPGGSECLVVLAQAIAQDGPGVLTDGDSDSLAAGAGLT